MKSARRAALDILLKWQKNKAYINKLLSYHSGTSVLSKQDLSFCHRLCLGVVERKIEIDFIISKLSNTPLNKINLSILTILELGIYQLKYLENVSDFAVCNEMTSLSKQIGLSRLSGFVNAILRNYLRKKDEILNSYPKKDNKIKYLYVHYSMPEWLCEHFINEIGFEKAEKAFKFFSENKCITVRALESKLSVDKAILLLENEGIEFCQNKYLNYVFDIKNPAKFLNSDIFNQGYFQVQDFSSILVGEVANPDFFDNILDICAAPGGKSLHLADILSKKYKFDNKNNEIGKIVSRDLYEFGAALIKKRAEQSGFDNLITEVKDATVFYEDDVEKYDLIIADLPCSGLGVIGKKPDIKYYIKKEDLKELSKLQFDILKNAVKYLKRGGALIYSTCTVSEIENDLQTDRIIGELNLEPAKINDRLYFADMTDDYKIQILPGEYDSDGFFISKFYKTAIR